MIYVMRFCEKPIGDVAKRWLEGYYADNVQIIEIPRFNFGKNPGLTVRKLFKSKRLRKLETVIIELDGPAKILGSVIEENNWRLDQNLRYISVVRQVLNPDFEGYELLDAQAIDWEIRTCPMERHTYSHQM